MSTRMVVVRAVTIASLVAAMTGMVMPRASAVNGCTPTNPVAAPGYTDTCEYVITPGGDYNASVAAQSVAVDVYDKGGALFRHLDIAGPGRQNVLTADEAAKLAGGKIKATITNGAAVIGCAACEEPAA